MEIRFENEHYGFHIKGIENMTVEDLCKELMKPEHNICRISVDIEGYNAIEKWLELHQTSYWINPNTGEWQPTEIDNATYHRQIRKVNTVSVSMDEHSNFYVSIYVGV